MTLPIEWSDMIDITEDIYSVRIERFESDWQQILDQLICLPQLTHLEFGEEITSVEFVEAILESNIMPNVEHILLPDSGISDSCWLQLHTLQSLHIRCHDHISLLSHPPFNHFTALTSLRIDSIPTYARIDTTEAVFAKWSARRMDLVAPISQAIATHFLGNSPTSS